MVVLTPMFEGERSCVCRCGHMGLSSSIRERNSFDGYICVPCRRRRDNAAYARRKKRRTKAQCDEARAMAREYKRKRRSTPEGRKRVNAAQREYARRRHADPERHAAALASERERRRNPKPPPPEPNPMVGRVTRKRRPVEPFREWLLELLQTVEGEPNPKTIVAARLGVGQRALARYLYEFETIDEGVVDWACTHEGSVTLADIYPDGAFAPLPKKKACPQNPRCASPGCREITTERFCPEHAALLARVREEMEAEVLVAPGRMGINPPCCNPACGNRRPRRECYCAECEGEGWGVGDD